MGKRREAKEAKAKASARPADWIERANLEGLERRSGKPLRDGERVHWTLGMRLSR